MLCEQTTDPHPSYSQETHPNTPHSSSVYEHHPPISGSVHHHLTSYSTRPTYQTKGILEAHLSNHTRHPGPTLTATGKQKATHQSSIPPNAETGREAGFLTCLQLCKLTHNQKQNLANPNLPTYPRTNHTPPHAAQQRTPLPTQTVTRVLTCITELKPTTARKWGSPTPSRYCGKSK
jgi:hypothetical protein